MAVRKGCAMEGREDMKRRVARKWTWGVQSSGRVRLMRRGIWDAGSEGRILKGLGRGPERCRERRSPILV